MRARLHHAAAGNARSAQGEVSMLKLTASSFVLVGCLSVSVLLPNATMAKTKYLLNCRLMDRAELLYDRFCRGENAK
jgi:hypothetical protein